MRCSEQNGGLSSLDPLLLRRRDGTGDGMTAPRHSSSDDNVRRREEDRDGGDDGERGEGDEAEPVDHHRGELRHAITMAGREGKGRSHSFIL